jgi:DnaK suppressor protein
LPGLAEVTMKKKDIERFKKMLLERKNAIIQTAETARESAMAVEQADLPDEVDMASSETGQALNLRLRDRELILLKKIDKTLAKIEEGEFGVCERCGEDITLKRLEARPVAQLCIRCKEELEKVEKGFAE